MHAFDATEVQLRAFSRLMRQDVRYAGDSRLRDRIAGQIEQLGVNDAAALAPT
ncbi:MAG: hypothetical protein ACLGI5_16570 [Thermoleophilia bacterium]